MLLACGPATAIAGAVQPAPASGRSQSNIDSRLQAEAKDPVTRQFYARNGWKPVWTDAAVEALRQALSDRARHGLDKLIFMRVLPASANGATREVALTRAALGYAGALAHGSVDPQKLHQIYTLPRPQVDLVGGLSDAIKAGSLATWFAALPPQDDGYAKLSSAYLDFSREARNDSTPDTDIAASGVIRVGDTDERVPAIVAQLLENEYLVPVQAPLPATGADASALSERPAVAKLGDSSHFTTRAFERETLAALKMPPQLVMRHRLPQFGHLFSSDSYSAGYYSYLWSEVMDGDTWAAFEESKTPWDPTIAQRYKDIILATGNTSDRSEAFRTFRGRDPDVKAYLEKRGFPVK